MGWFERTAGVPFRRWPIRWLLWKLIGDRYVLVERAAYEEYRRDRERAIVPARDELPKWHSPYV